MKIVRRTNRVIYLSDVSTFSTLGSGADDPDFSVDPSRSRANFRGPEILYIFRGNRWCEYFFYHGQWGQWPWLFRQPQQVQGKLPRPWNCIYIPQKLLYLSGWCWFQFSIRAQCHGSPTRKFLIYTNLADSISRSIQPVLSCTSSNKLTKGKSQKVPQNLDNPKNRRTLEGGWALGHLPYSLRKEIRVGSPFPKIFISHPTLFFTWNWCRIWFKYRSCSCTFSVFWNHKQKI